jgi:16S rRNA processing protein RimM
LEAFVTIAKIVKLRGVKGELAAELHTDFPERFEKVGQVRLVSGERVYWEKLENFWFHKGRVILKLVGWENRDAIQQFVGYEVQVPEKEAMVLPEECYFWHQLVGCEIFDKGEGLGVVTEVFEVGSAGLNLVVQNEETEWMLPWVRQFIERVDLENNIIDAVVPLGLMETTAQPLKK